MTGAEIVCERCGERPATLHWTESFDGAIVERHLCEECRFEEPPGQLPDFGQLCFHCRCGAILDWRYPNGRCGHPPEDYELIGRRECEIASCECGARYFTVGMRWRCKACGAESILEPRPVGEHGYLLDHLYGLRKGAEIKIRAVIP